MTRAGGALAPLLLLALAAAGCAAARVPLPAPGAPLSLPGEEWGPSGSGAYGSRPGRRWEDASRVYGTFMPYAWRASGSGDALVNDVPVSFDEADGPDDGDLTFGGRAEMYSERVGFYLDGFYTRISADDRGTEYDDRYFTVDLGAAMRLAGAEPWHMMEERGPVDFEFDGLAFVRSHWLTMDAAPPGSYSSASDDAVWIDLGVGARAGVVLLGRITLYGKIDGGGFAVDEWQSWTWNGEAGAKVRITRNLGGVLAYRWYASHWQDGTPEEVVTPYGVDHLDSERTIRLQGPWVGIVLEF